MTSDKKAKVIAFYLPQFHPTPDNDLWWGKGFTEWTNVGKAKRYFLGHKQPKVPTELGYYDLRLSEVREAQAQLAIDAGVDCFCYWHYWLGGGKRLLEMPLEEVVREGKPNFPFCLGWANHSWARNNWSSNVSRLNRDVLIEQLYPGKDDIDRHFYAMLETFRDRRYYKLHGRLVFLIYKPKDVPDLKYFMDRWQSLAEANNLPGFYFIGYKLSEEPNSPIYKLFDAITISTINSLFHQSRVRKAISLIFKIPFVTKYQNVLVKNLLEEYKSPKVYPCIYPNWDTTPRRGPWGQVLYGSSPELFKKNIEQILELIKGKDKEDRVIFLKSWNEWGEGNYMEPDMEHGRGYIDSLAEAIIE